MPRATFLQLFAGALILYWVLRPEGGNTPGLILAGIADQSAYTVRTAEGHG